MFLELRNGVGVVEDLITVIVPVYNVEKYLDRCMQSILSQTYSNLEIILIDDLSTDKSNTICLEYRKVDARVVVVVHGKNEGLSGARNSGLDMAHGKYVVFIDSDDYIQNDMIENLHTCMINTGADTVIGGFRRAIGSRVEVRKNMFAGTIYDNTEDIKNLVLKRMLGSDGKDMIEMSVWKTMFSLSIIKEHNLRFPDRTYLCEDIIFDFDYFPLAKKVAMCDDTGYCYCLNQASLSQKYQKNKEEKIAFQAAEMTDRAKALQFDENAFIRIDNFFVGNLIHHIKTMVANASKIGKKECWKNCREICNLENVRKIKWDKINLCYRGKDRIPFLLFKNNHPILLYGYMWVLTKMRSCIRTE